MLDIVRVIVAVQLVGILLLLLLLLPLLVLLLPLLVLLLPLLVLLLPLLVLLLLPITIIRVMIITGHEKRMEESRQELKFFVLVVAHGELIKLPRHMNFESPRYVDPFRA